MERKTCPSCGAEIDADHPQGLCPACLLKQGMAPEPAGEGDPIRKALEAKLQSQYRIVRMLGRGGMGAVYLARDLTLDREVAIKVVHAAADSRELYDRFRREAKTAAKLSHPNIVPLHAFGEVEGMPYFVMGYVRGESLAERLRRDGRIPEEEAQRILGEIADALDHAHRLGVIHRDIKPDNVLLDDESGRALLTDFGVAKAVGKGETLTRLGSVVGTPHYMSPEQAAGRADLDGRSDIYSLGVMGYAMIAGRLPFEGPTAADVLTKHLTQEPPPLRSVAPGVSDAMAQMVERCLAKDPAARWEDARSLARALGTAEAIQLPDSLHAVEGRGLPAALVLAPLTIVLALVAQEDPLEALGIGVSTFSGIAFCYLFLLASLRREGFSARQSQSAIWREPSWWLFWYPRALRKRGNVWDRLPVAVRHFRHGSFALVVLYFLSGAFGFLWRGSHRDISGVTGYIWMSTVTLALLLWFLLRHRAKRALRDKGLGGLDPFRILLSVPPSRVAFWARPHIAAILAPAAAAEAGRRADSPNDLLQSIIRDANELSGPLRPLGAEAAVAARQLLESIGQADREIADLARNIEPGEEERLADKIAALAPVAGRADDAAPLRSLLEKQLDLIRGLSARIEEAKERRNRRVEMLKTLTLHVASLRTRIAETPSTVRSLSDNVRALCDEIGRQELALSGAAGGDEMKTIERTPSS